MAKLPVTYEDIVAAHERIADGIRRTPCPESPPLSELTGSRIFVKKEYRQHTGSFKEHGARNALMTLDPDRAKRGVVAASVGNHALGLAHHGALLGIPVTVVMPTTAPLIKVTTCRRLGAEVLLHGQDFATAKEEADRLRDQRDLTYIHGYDDPAIIAGQGTMALEILKQVPDMDALVVPIGGGGLIAGAALAIKTRKPKVKIIGIEPINAPCYHAALKAGRPVACPTRPTLADGLQVAEIGGNAFAIAREHVDRAVKVDEGLLALAILRLVELEKVVVEGGAAASLAPFLGDLLPELAGRTVVLTLSGGNIDPTILSRVIERGLVVDGRLARFTAQISDRPGGLAQVTRLIAEAGASVKEITHDRAFSGPDVSAVTILCTVETRDREHIRELYDRLREANITLVVRAGEGS